MRARIVPTRIYEEAAEEQGFHLIAGVDEVGRGPWAGPLVAAAVILPLGLEAPWLRRLRDSKLLSPARRQELANRIWEAALAVGLGVAEAEQIDRMGVQRATQEAMHQALAALAPPPDYVLVDGPSVVLPLACPYQCLVDGDARCLSIAAASIVAKVWRDQRMAKEDLRYRGYGFARHKGYGTPQHRQALERLGPCPLHRRSFAPVRRLLEAPVPAAHRRQRLGQSAERLAAAELQKRGLSIWGRNVRTPYGELDIVAREGETWVFVEVRARRGDAMGAPEESLTAAKRQHLIAAAQHVLMEQEALAASWRIDLVAVALDKAGRVLRVEQTKHAIESAEA